MKAIIERIAQVLRHNVMAVITTPAGTPARCPYGDMDIETLLERYAEMEAELKQLKDEKYLRVCDDCRGADYGWITTEGNFGGPQECPACKKVAELYTFRPAYIMNHRAEIERLKKELADYDDYMEKNTNGT